VNRWHLLEIGLCAGLAISTAGSGKQVSAPRLAHLKLIGSYLTATAQMNMAVGREVIL
jgi:hypothetical protein